MNLKYAYDPHTLMRYEEAMMKNIQAIMSPRSIAVVGATNRPGSVGHAVFENIISNGYQGILYPVNPKSKSVHSVKAYPRLKDIPDSVDMAVVIVPSEIVPSIIEEAAEKEVKGVVVITAGFKEIGGHGVELERQVKETAKKNNIRLVGPNCLGVINTHPDVRMNASFAHSNPKTGKHRLYLSIRSAGHGRARFCGGPPRGLFQIRELREQGRRQRGRSAPLPQGRPADRSDSHVPGRHHRRP